jgi:Domain of unknown function (DUF6473)
MTDQNTNPFNHWNPDYQKRDWEIVDYEQYYLEGIAEPLRGPSVDTSGKDYFTCIGATQTYGIFVEKPFPHLISRTIGIPALNLSLPAAGPGFFAHHQAIIDYINGGKFLILQIMAARAEPNRYFDQAGYCETVRERSTGDIMSSRTAWQKIIEDSSYDLGAAVNDSQQSWIESNKAIIEKVKVPIILFWISHDRLDSDILDTTGLSIDKLFFEFPQLVDKNCVDAIKPLTQSYAACNSRTNWGHQLISRFTGEPTDADYGLLHPSGKDLPPMTHNTYYPSPEMHVEAATILLEAISDLGLFGQPAN